MRFLPKNLKQMKILKITMGEKSCHKGHFFFLRSQKIFQKAWHMSRPFLTLLFSKTLLFCLLYCWKNRCYVYMMRYWGCRTKLWTEIDDTKNFVEWMRLSLFTHTLKCIRENGQLRFGKFKIFVDSIINFNARKTTFEL